jgi:hypothetical protein
MMIFNMSTSYFHKQIHFIIWRIILRKVGMLKNNNNNNNCLFVCLFVGPGTITLHPSFGSFILLELVSLVKVFRLFRLEWILVVPNVLSSSYVSLQPSSQSVPNVFSSSYVCLQPSSQYVPNVFSSIYVSLQPSSQFVPNVSSSSYVSIQPSSQCVPQHVPNGTLLYNLVSFALKFYSL